MVFRCKKYHFSTGLPAIDKTVADADYLCSKNLKLL